MGKATIVSGGTSGLYQISIKYDNRALDKRLAAIDAQIARITFSAIPAAQARYDEEKVKAETAAETLNTEIANYVASGEGGGGGPIPIQLVAAALADAAGAANLRVGQQIIAAALASAAASADLKYGSPILAAGLCSATASSTLS